jgi:isocitrate dehydrogenase
MFSLHVKATMMKVSHPIVFGHAVKVFYKDLFAKHGKLFEELGVNPNNGISSVYEKIQDLPEQQREEIEHDIHACYESRPELAMVDSVKGISNLHAPNDVIVDASMPAMIRAGGKMWGPDGKLKDTKAVMPESTYARIYQEFINFCKAHGAFDQATMGSVRTWLMPQQARSMARTTRPSRSRRTASADRRPTAGADRAAGRNGRHLAMCETRDATIRDRIKLAVNRARLSSTPAVFWLGEYRPHDAERSEGQALPAGLRPHGLDIRSCSTRAMRYTLERVLCGWNDLGQATFPATDRPADHGARQREKCCRSCRWWQAAATNRCRRLGPQHVKQLLGENHLRWDSLGEFLALAVAGGLGIKTSNRKDPREDARRGDRATRQRKSPPPAPESSTIAAVTSISRSIGRRRLPSDRGPRAPGHSRALRRTRGEQQKIVGSSTSGQTNRHRRLLQPRRAAPAPQSQATFNAAPGNRA